ncbi:MAG TPA: hypothetical protein VIG88_10335 [Lysobacter sp.]
MLELAGDEAGQIDALENFVEPLFYSLGDRDRWAMTTADRAAVLTKYDTLSVDRAALRQAADYYFTCLPWLRHPHLDWLLANALIFVELAATARIWSPVYEQSGKTDWRIFSAVAAWSVIKLAMLVVAVGAAIGLGAVWAAWGLAGVAAVRWGMRTFWARKRLRILASMFNAYESTKSSTLSWNVVWEELSRARSLGAYWDPELYRLVELARDSAGHTKGH